MLRIFGRSTVRIQESCRTMQRPWKSWLQFTGVTSSKRGCSGVERLCWSTSGEGWRNALRKTKEDSKGKLYFFLVNSKKLHGNKMDTESICHLHCCWYNKIESLRHKHSPNILPPVLMRCLYQSNVPSIRPLFLCYPV